MNLDALLEEAVEAAEHVEVTCHAYAWQVRFEWTTATGTSRDHGPWHNPGERGLLDVLSCAARELTLAAKREGLMHRAGSCASVRYRTFMEATDSLSRVRTVVPGDLRGLVETCTWTGKLLFTVNGVPLRRAHPGMAVKDLHAFDGAVVGACGVWAFRAGAFTFPLPVAFTVSCRDPKSKRPSRRSSSQGGPRTRRLVSFDTV